MMAWIAQQSLPRSKIPHFDGSPLTWVEFVVRFKDLVHDQTYLTDTQKMAYLIQHLEGEAKCACQGFTNDWLGYVMALKRLKYMFGQKSRVAQAHIDKVTRGRSIQNDDVPGLVQFYYTLSDCIVKLRQLNYVSDMYSSDVLRQAVRRLPTRLHNKWAEQCFRLRRHEEPTIIFLESWLQNRILASKEGSLPNWPDERPRKLKSKSAK